MLRFLMIGAHPDDPEEGTGGLTLKLRAKGHEVIFLSVTNGNAGHHRMDRDALRARRLEEMRRVAEVYDIRYDTLDLDDGYLTADIPTREKLTRYIRALSPDVILAHRTSDYHPDHRAVGQLVCDCSYMIGVPLFCPDAPVPAKRPVILSVEDQCATSNPFRPDIAVDIGAFVRGKIEGLLCHESQYYEWLPYDGNWTGVLEAKSRAEAEACLISQELELFKGPVRRFPDRFAPDTVWGEVYQIDDYGAPMTEEIRSAMED
ncbi:MAG: PIG-L deacetylase family protein [Clostridia bacterium]|nr:PIG-L deacetylase family protein [Clostridia bacterium]